MQWIEVVIKTKSEAVEAITAFLHEMGVGVSIEDPLDTINYVPRTPDAMLDEKLIKKPTDPAIIKFYFPEDTNIQEKLLYIKERLSEISKYMDIGEGSVETSTLDEVNWQDAWKKYYKPIKVGEKIVIKPVWEEYEAKDSEIIVTLDPGMAFGTGTHETTRMCIRLLEKTVQNKTLFDIGCGSGILGICASKLGATNVIGVDMDPVAVKASRQNAAMNNISNIDVREGNLLDVVSEKADIVVANIIADVIIYLSGVIKDYLNEKGIFICSGIINDRLDDVKSALSANGFEILEILNEGEWVGIKSKMI